jgi:hypothetical protein
MMNSIGMKAVNPTNINDVAKEVFSKPVNDIQNEIVRFNKPLNEPPTVVYVPRESDKQTQISLEDNSTNQ